MEIKYFIRENTVLGRMAAINLRKSRCAIVVNKTIYLWGIDKATFMRDEKYLNHELQHVYQYWQLGVVRFVFAYTLESLRKGYYMNKFEVEAREAETQPRRAEYILVED
jgi:hypothetical protein